MPDDASNPHTGRSPAITPASDRYHRNLAAMNTLREEFERTIERLMDILDNLDAPDEDREDDTEDAEVHPGGGFIDDEDGGDNEPCLGSINPTISGGQVMWAAGCSDDRELGDDNGIADRDGAVEQGWLGMM